jgi:hypothetical protein
MKRYECWIRTDGNTLQAICVQVKAENHLIAEQELIRLHQPVKVLGKAFIVRNIVKQDISCSLI